MSAATMLVFGKTMLWFVIPLGLALWELHRLRVNRDRAREPD